MPLSRGPPARRTALPPLLALVLAAGAWAGPSSAGPSSAGPSSGPAVLSLWVELGPRADPAVVRALGMGFAEGQQGGWWRLDGPPGVTRSLDARGLRWRPALAARIAKVAGYHDADQVLARLQDLADADPERVEVVDLGTSTEGRTLRALRVGVAQSPRATWRLVGTHHGDEWASSEVALDAAIRLAAAAAAPRADPELHALLQTDQVWVLPQLNPDGFQAQRRYSATSVDLNRNYDYRWTDEEWLPGPAPFSEPETRAMRALQSWVPFALGLSFHAGAANIGWVWNHTETPTKDDDLLQGLADLYGDACTTPGFWRTNGAAWYPTWGDLNDWSYGRLGALDFTVEVSVDKMPEGEALDELRAQHWPAVRAFLLGATLVEGQVRDATTRRGIPAAVMPAAVTSAAGAAAGAGEGWPAATGPDGRFARALSEPLHLEVTAPGYQAAQVWAEPGAALVVELDPVALVQVRPDPLLLPADQVVSFQLDVPSSALVLSRPGYPSVPAWPIATGWAVDTTDLAPGPWDLTLDDGAAPRALFVAEADDAVQIDQVQALHGALRVTGQGFAAGSRAWALTGVERAPVPLPVRAWTPDELWLDPPAAGQIVDLVLLSAGRQVVAFDVGAPDGGGVDTGADDSGSNDSGSNDSGSNGSGSNGSGSDPAGSDAAADGGGQTPADPACACASPSPARGPLLFAPPLLLLLLRRRSQP